MKIPPPPAPDLSLPAEARIGFVIGWQTGYRRGFRDGNPGRKTTAAKAQAARANGAKPCALGKKRGRPKIAKT